MMGGTLRGALQVRSCSRVYEGIRSRMCQYSRSGGLVVMQNRDEQRGRRERETWAIERDVPESSKAGGGFVDEVSVWATYKVSASTVRLSSQHEEVRTGETMVVEEQGAGSFSIGQRPDFNLGV